MAALRTVQRWSSERGWCSEPVQGGVGGEEMALGAGAGAEWSRVLTGCIVGNCRGNRRERATVLQSVKKSASGSVAAANGPEEA